MARHDDGRALLDNAHKKQERADASPESAEGARRRPEIAGSADVAKLRTMKSLRLRTVFATALATLVASSASIAACGGSISDAPDGAVGPIPTTTTPPADGSVLPDSAPPPGDAATPDAAIDFTSASCTLEDLTQGLMSAKPSKPFNYLELRQSLLRFEDGGLVVDTSTTLAFAGVKCSGATDAAACGAALDTASATKDLFPPAGGRQIPMARYFVVQSGDEVSVVATRAELLTFLGPIDTGSEAKLLVAADGYEPLCGADSVREVPGGYEVVARKNTECLNQYMGYVLSVTSAGVVAVKATVDLRDPDAGCAVAGRRPEGFSPRVARGESELLQYLGTMRSLEAASVPAFLRLATELREHGAPSALVARAEEAARDEVRHAAGFSRLRAERGATTTDDALGVPTTPRSLEALAIENAVEGCVRETFGALVASYQATHATDPRVRRLFASIAEDELRHAELAWDVSEWLDAKLDDDGRARVREAEAGAARELGHGVARAEPGRELRELCGLPSAAQARLLFGATSALWAA